MSEKDRQQLLQQLRQEDEQDVTEEIAAFEEQYNRELISPGPSTKTVFGYAVTLIHSRSNVDRKKGVNHLTNLLASDQDNRDYLYFLSMGHFKLEEFAAAREYAERLLVLEPNNRQASALRAISEDKLRNEGLVGMALVGAAATAIVAGIIIATKRR
eukprot:TRINITY_DN13005_c0_g1_i1.p1 TRINITY_DN13005_c0_g1~~TRINITY_DN13005_c0_g1_i1.p1  ORF type:complete len:157 (+),score=41.40 TRINITY_DN13005_c0_g1_i1:146-616(+)